MLLYIYFLLSWLFFGLMHSLTAALWFKHAVTTRLGNHVRFYRLLYNGFSILTLLPVIVLYCQLPVTYLSSWQGSLWLGGSLVIAGVLIGLLAFREYDLPAFIGWPTSGQGQAESEFSQAGLLRYTRHPLYLGFIVILVGMVVSQPAWRALLLLATGTLYLRIGIYFEEKKLVTEFGEAYKQYQRRVPMLFPGLSSF